MTVKLTPKELKERIEKRVYSFQKKDNAYVVKYSQSGKEYSFKYSLIELAKRMNVITQDEYEAYKGKKNCSPTKLKMIENLRRVGYTEEQIQEMEKYL